MSVQIHRASPASSGSAGLTNATNSPFTATSGANVTFTPSGGNDIVIEWNGVSSNTATRCLAIKPLFGGSTSATVDSIDTDGTPNVTSRTGVTSMSLAGSSSTDLTAAETCSGKITVEDYQSTTGFKNFSGYWQKDSLSLAADRQFFNGVIRNTAAINGILVEWTNASNETAQAATSFDAGSIKCSTRV